MRDLEEYVRHYVRELSGSKAENAWHSLVEAGPTALPYLVNAFEAATEPRVRVSLVQVIAQYRSAERVPFLETLLRDGKPEIWKAALDGLVMCGGTAALAALRAARAITTSEKRQWIDEAVGQITETHRPG
jgi:HEAT repeat protein